MTFHVLTALVLAGVLHPATGHADVSSAVIPESSDLQCLIGPALALPEPGTLVGIVLLLIPVLVNGIRIWRRRDEP